jgi:hypothetical protein
MEARLVDICPFTQFLPLIPGFPIAGPEEGEQNYAEDAAGEEEEDAAAAHGGKVAEDFKLKTLNFREFQNSK